VKTMQKLDWLSEAARRLEFVPKSYFERFDISTIFERRAPLEVDIGCGEGALLLGMAGKHPERNYLGLERLLGRVHTVCRAAAKARLSNVRLMRIESLYAVEHLFPAQSVSVAHILFPDPWPKRHHQPRRLIQEKFLRALHGILEPGGELRIKTDDLPYFQWMHKAFAKVSELFTEAEWPNEPDYPCTDFEKRFLAQGLPIHRVLLRKV